jgi:hypothetical protein
MKYLKYGAWRLYVDLMCCMALVTYGLGIWHLRLGIGVRAGLCMVYVLNALDIWTQDLA